jgi:hypothetical protein
LSRDFEIARLAILSFNELRRPGSNWKVSFVREIEALLELKHFLIISWFEYSMPTEDELADWQSSFVE